MKLEIQNQFKVKGQNNEDFLISTPYVNDQKELEFKHCNFFRGKVTFNMEKRALELHHNKKRICLLLEGRNAQLYQELVALRRTILLDVTSLQHRFEAGEEPIYAVSFNGLGYPFLITTPTVLENGRYSVKYRNAILYFLNIALKESGKSILPGYEKMTELVGIKLESADKTNYKKGLIGEEIYYSIPLKKIVELF